MTSPRIVSVFGATGLQGGAVVDALLKNGTFVPRAITRDLDSEPSTKLKERGIEVVKADALDKATLVAALRGSEAVFAVTVPVFASPSMEGKGEFVQGKNMVDAAKEVGVKFFIWTSLPSISEISGGKYKNVVFCEEKAAVQEYLKSSGLTHASLLLPAFLENLYTAPFQFLKSTDEGYHIDYVILKPTDKESFAWTSRDVPAAALALLNNYTDPTKEINGKAYPVVSATISLAELAQIAEKVLGKKVLLTTAPPTGLVALDEMFTAHGEYSGLYTDTAVPNPDLVALGMKFSSVEDFMREELKPRYVQ
ncbi:NmrA domain-containing protein [Favolaschia claudopus]|uniref:NmrA domain-containing protein n=1 Tax=Favolaschia claudopus TaxID=2862362 RepID=A0AAW0EA03_9AGAR